MRAISIEEYIRIERCDRFIKTVTEALDGLAVDDAIAILMTVVSNTIQESDNPPHRLAFIVERLLQEIQFYKELSSVDGMPMQ